MTRAEFSKLAAGKKSSSYRPVWLMRQAGRYLPEYRAIRANNSFLELCHNPELASEVSLQPIEIFGFDLAVIFSDILLPLVDLDFFLEFPESGGIKINTPKEFSLESLESLSREQFRKLLENKSGGIASSSRVIELVRQKLSSQKKDLPIIGFCGGAWTLATYILEGGTSKRKNREYSQLKKLCYQEPQKARNLLKYLSNFMALYLNQQIQAGVDLIQVFDTLAGEVSIEIFRSFVVPSLKDLLEKLPKQVPKVLYVKNSSPYLKEIASLGFQILSLDWKVSLHQAEELVFSEPNNTIRAFQGNLDPLILTLDPLTTEVETRKLLEEAESLRVPLVFNLGHGITPEAKVENVRRLREIIREPSK